MYSKIESKFWMDEKTTTISPDARYIMLYLLTSPHKNMLGFYYLPKPYIIHDVKLSPDRFEQGFRELLNSKMIFYDEKASVMLLPNYLKHNPLDNPNVVKSAIEKLDELPKNTLEPMFLKAIQRYHKLFYKPLVESMRERLNTPAEVEKEPETETEDKTVPETSDTKSGEETVTTANESTSHEESAEEDYCKWIDVLENRFGELTGRLIPSPKDIQNMRNALRIAKGRVDIIIAIMEEAAKNYKSPYPGAKIRSFNYFMPAIQEKIALFEAKQSAPTTKTMTPEEKQQSEKLTQEILEAIPDEILNELEMGGENVE